MRLICLFLCNWVCFAQAPKRLSPVTWTMEFAQPEAKPGGSAMAKLTAAIEEPWHLYSPTTPPGGPIITTIGLEDNPALESFRVYRPQPVRKFDPNFNIDTETYEKKAVFFIS